MPVTFIEPKEKKSYNDRLFSSGLRGYFHEARFRWLHEAMQRLKVQPGSVIELGCFDGKTIRYLPFAPSVYVGYDANWEGGLDEAFLIWKEHPAYTFIKSSDLNDFNPSHQVFDYSIAMETLEHLPVADLNGYLQMLAAATRQYCFITLPNETGIVFLLKHLAKLAKRKVDEPYTLKEAWYATLGKQHKVKRTEGGHKGFDYRQLLRLLQMHFEVVEITKLPFASLPLFLNFTIGIVVKKRQIMI